VWNWGGGNEILGTVPAPMPGVPVVPPICTVQSCGSSPLLFCAWTLGLVQSNSRPFRPEHCPNFCENPQVEKPQV
jgi:hypothetical protein